MFSRTLASALFLSFASCASTFVPIAEDNAAPSVQGTQGSDLDSVIYQGEAAEEAKNSKGPRSAIIFLVGQRSLDTQDWLPVEDQVFFGAEYSYLPANSPLGFEVGLAGSFAQEDILLSGNLYTARGSTVEFYGGPRFETALGDSPVRVYGGIGPSLISATFELERFSSVSESDSSLGLYAHAGLLLEFGKAYFGLDLRTLAGTSITLFNYETDADYTQIALALGFRF